ncbi:PREDICTED: CD151 antigen-like [Priapulus caudatus]|uniref:Tetraspanin n=1 Tax=Priapulus caudatus TaxID=37621 RepID=A0ABM1E1P6_PRICU|nr:PREDICTED: CD151 antigen-like [Priapulus caudatus]
MAVEGTFKLMKYLLLVFTFCFWMTAIAMTTVGLWFIGDIRFLEFIKYISAVEGSPDLWSMRASGILMLVLGICGLVIGFFGCLGSFKENKFLLSTFFVLVSFLLLGVIAVTVWALISRAKMYELLYAEIDRYVNLYYTPGYDDIHFTLDHLQQFSRCCGANGTVDYAVRNVEIPKSCINGYTGERYLSGCSEEIMNRYRRHFGMLISLGTMVIAELMVGLMCTLCLCSSISEQDDKFR